MSALAPAAVRLRIDAAIALVSGFSRSRFGYEVFGQDARVLAHGAYAVGITQTTAHRADVRQVRAAGLMVESEISVRMSANYRADAQVTDSDIGLSLEVLMLHAVMGASLVNLHVSYVDSSREITNDAEFWLSTTRFRCIHRISLE